MEKQVCQGKQLRFFIFILSSVFQRDFTAPILTQAIALWAFRPEQVLRVSCLYKSLAGARLWLMVRGVRKRGRI